MFKLDCSLKGVATLNCLPNLFANIIFWLLAFSGTAALFFVIFSGIRIITSGGDAKQLDEARKSLTFAVLGLILILVSFLIINLVSTVTGVECIKKFGFTNCLQNITQPSGSTQTERRISPQNKLLNP